MKSPIARKIDGRTKAAKYNLRHSNYYDPERPHLSSSRLRDYFKSPHLFYKKHVQKSIPPLTLDSKPVKRGQLVDKMLTEDSIEPYEIKVLKRDDPDTYQAQKDTPSHHLVRQSTFDEATQIVTAIEDTQAWEQIIDPAQPPMFQPILEAQISKTPVCGMADVIKPLSNSDEFDYALVDIKTTTPRSLEYWSRHVDDFHYTNQLALYRDMLAFQKDTSPKRIACYHLTAAYVEDGLTKIELFRFPSANLDKAMDEIHKAITSIENEHFPKPDVTFDNPSVIPEVWQENE